jgi:hypothetical protein
MLVRRLDRGLNPIRNLELFLKVVNQRRLRLHHLASHQVFELHQVDEGFLLHHFFPSEVDEMIGYDVEVRRY